MLDLGEFADRIVATRSIPAREGSYAGIPAGCHPDLRAALEALGRERLYSHQAEMFERALAGDNVVITTGTASGKSLSYLMPVIQAALEDQAARALLLFPTKALTQDQLRGILDILESMGSLPIEAGVYDGDTPPVERTRIRQRANLVLTNPDMLNSAWLPNHGRRGFSHVFRNVKYVVIDEMHTYRGAFGSHFANLMRRLQRICRHYGSEPRFLCSSATIANPGDLAERLCGVDFHAVEEDGSPSTGKTVHFWQPPLEDNEYRRAVAQEMSEFVPWLIGRRHRTIAFTRSRKETEVVLKECRDRLSDVDGGHDESGLVAGYRGGYTPIERREVERSLLDGSLLGVVSTNALELGVDIGALEVVVQGGFPGTRASFWQQIGRAGRRDRHAHAFVILRAAPMDQFIASDPDWLMGRPSEHAVVDPDNLMIQLAHTRAAAAELPLTLDDAARFPDLGEMIPIMLEAGEVREVYGTFHWCGPAHPAGDFSLRNLDDARFKIVNRATGVTITEMDRPETYRDAHPKAVYLHDGHEYLVEELDLVQRVATVMPVRQDYYTAPDVRTTIDVIRIQEEVPFHRTRAFFGDVHIDETTVGYKMLQFHNHQNLGYEKLDDPLTIELDTEATWLAVPEDVLTVLGDRAADYLRGVVHGMLSRARMLSMAAGHDMGGTSFHASEEGSGRTRNAVIVYDHHHGGLGFAARTFEVLEDVMRGAIALLERCRCRRGCPACVGDYLLDRELILWAMESFFESSAPPARFAAALPVEPVLEERRDFAWQDVEGRWKELRRELAATGVPGAEVLDRVDAVKVLKTKLVCSVSSPGLATWMESKAARRRLERLIASRVEVPEGWRLDVRVDETQRERAHATGNKLKRRFDDLTAES